MFVSRVFLAFPHLSVLHYCTIFENVLYIRWHCCAVLGPMPVLHFFAHLLIPVLHLLHFPANFLNVLGSCCSVVSSHFSLCLRPLFPSPLFSLMIHLFLSYSLCRNEGLVGPSLLVIISNFSHSFSVAVHSAAVLLPSYLELCISRVQISIRICVLICLGPLFCCCQKLLSP